MGKTGCSFYGLVDWSIDVKNVSLGSAALEDEFPASLLNK